VSKLTIDRTYLSLIHPRLLTTLVLLDPVIISKEAHSKYDAFNVARMSTWRRNIWASPEEAASSFKKSKFFAAWDPRVLERWLQYGLRKLPTALYPDSTEDDTRALYPDSTEDDTRALYPDSTEDDTRALYPDSTDDDTRVTLKTKKHQEVFTFLRPNFELFETGQFDPKNHPDVDAEAAMNSPFVRPESLEIFRRLPNVRPSILYVFGGESDLSTPVRRKAKLDVTGTGIGGNGGAKAGRVKEVVLEGVGHLMAMEAVGPSSDSVTQWIGTELERWKEEEEEFRSTWAQKSMIEKTTIDDKWRGMMRVPPGITIPPAKSNL
jgi:hypothetical protein